MRSRFFLSLISVTGSLFLVGTGAQAAGTQLSFYPAQKWTVSNSGGQCQLSNEYNNGYILRLDGDAQGAQTVKVDFRQDVFEAQKKYDVALSVPGIMTISPDTSAETASVLDLNVSENTDLYKALASSGVLDLSIEGNDFRFFMTGFGSKMAELNACINPVVEAKPVQEMVMADVVMAEPSAQETIEAAPKSAHKADPELIEELSDFVNSSVAEDVKKTTAPVAQDDTPEKLEKASVAKISKPMELETQEPAPAPKTISYSTPEPVIVRHVEKGTMDITEAGLRPEPKPEPKVDVSLYTNEIASLEKELQDLKAANMQMQEKVERLDRDGVPASYKIGADNWDLEKATMRYQEAEHQMTLLGQKLQRERAQCDMEKKEIEAMLFDPQLTNQRQLAELAKLEDELAEAQKNLINQRLQYEERIKILQKQISGL